jgi:hypothetical protein
MDYILTTFESIFQSEFIQNKMNYNLIQPLFSNIEI